MRSDVPLPWRNPDGCLIWQGRVDANGYGRRGAGWAHIKAWEEANGRKVKPGHEINHKCRVPLCVEPAHLEELTKAQHYALRPRPGCAKGHDEWIERKDGKGRQCRACKRERERRYRDANV